MKCCTRCFEDKVIKNLILDTGIIGECDFCKNKETKVISLENETLKYYFEALLDIYVPIDKIKNYPMSKGELLKNILKKDWNIFSELMSAHKVEDFLRILLPEKEILYNGKVGISSNKNKAELSILGNYKWEDFVNEIKKENRFHTKIFNLDNLKYFLSRLSEKLDNRKKLYRGRISLKQEGYRIDEMGAPPHEVATSGRINPEGISCLYLAEDEETIHLEVRAMKHDYITIGEFKLKDEISEISVVDLTKIDRLSPFLDLDEISKHVINQECLKKIAEEISKPQRRVNTALNYLPGQYISEFIKSLEFSGIKFKSTLKEGGINYAIFNQEDFECIRVKVHEVKDIQCRTGILENN